MSPVTWIVQHRVLGIGALIATFLVVVLAGWWFFVLRSPGTPLNVHQALNLYRQQQRHRANSTARLPTSGVYRYRTRGGEQLSVGVNRSFPAQTSMVVTDASCSTLLWEPFEQHSEGLMVCPIATGGLQIEQTSSNESIAGLRTSTIIDCPSNSYLVPPHPWVGEGWSTTCHSTGETIVLTGTFLGESSVSVDHRELPALHTHLDFRFSGSVNGENPNDYWISWPSGLVLRQTETADLTQRAGPLGSVRYTERMAINLMSSIPIR